MAIPKWQTPSGLLADIEERVLYEQQLVATDSDGDTLVYSLQAGALPSGLNLTSSGKIAGFPNEVSVRTENIFVVRVSDGTHSVDRTFTIFVEGSDAPVWITPAGTLATVYDGTFVDIQLEVTDTDTADSTAISYEIVEGELPDTLSLGATSGRITGAISPIPEEAYDSTQIGWDAEGFDTAQSFDQIIRLGSIDRLWQFTVRASDGVTAADRTFALDVKGLGKFTADETQVTADNTEYTSDASDNRTFYFTQSGIIATLSSGDYHIVKLTVIDPDEALGIDGGTTITFNIESGSLPPDMSINPDNGVISGIVPKALNSFTDYEFTVRGTKSNALFTDDVIVDQSMTIRVTGQAFDTVTWNQPSKELVI